MVTSRLRPLDVNLSFEDRTFTLGETINLTVELTARGDVEVREGRVDLMCYERWTEIYTVMVVAAGRPSLATSLATGAGAVHLPPRIPKQVTKEHKESYVHSSVIFLEETQLDPNTTSSYTFGIDIQEESPPHAKEATVRWNLVTVVDVARARDIKTRYPVKVTVD